MNQEGRRLLKKSSCHAQKPCSEENQEAHDLAMMAISQLYNFLVFLLSLSLVFTQISHNHLGAFCQSFTIPRKGKIFSKLRNWWMVLCKIHQLLDRHGILQKFAFQNILNIHFRLNMHHKEIEVNIFV